MSCRKVVRKLKDLELDPISCKKEKFRDNLYQDILAVKGILYKFDCEEILEDINLFAAFLNELGFRTQRGNEITYHFIVQLISDDKRLNNNELTNKSKKQQLNSFRYF